MVEPTLQLGLGAVMYYRNRLEKIGIDALALCFKGGVDSMW